MKITKQRLKQIIKEEVQAKLQEIEDEDIVSKQADMDEKAKQADMDEKAEQAAEDVMGEIEELFETEINEAVKLQFRRKKQTPTKTKTKEIEVPTDEEAFTVLQRIVKSINKKALEYETDPEQVAELIDYKTQVYKNMAKKMGAIMLIASILGGFSTLIQSGLDQEQVARAQQRAELQAQNIEASQSHDAMVSEFQNYINNPASFRWGRGEENMMQLPDSTQTRNGLPRGIDVLPPSYSVAIVALSDKQNLTPRFDMPETIVDFSSGTASQQQIKTNMDNFFEDFTIEDGDFIKGREAFNIEGVSTIPSSGLQRDTIMVNPRVLFENPDYVLPENGLTVQEYYNMLYYDQFLSIEEAEAYGIDK